MSEPNASEATPIYLVGMMGSGKSTVGPCLARRLVRPFVDTDEEVEKAAGLTIAEIFAQRGEAAFRALEAAAIEGASEDAAVVALGGGAIAEPGMADRLEARGTIVWLRAEAATLVDRLGEGETRPLLAGLDRDERLAKLEALLEERRVYYGRASIEIDAREDPEPVVDAIVAALGRGD